MLLKSLLLVLALSVVSATAWAQAPQKTIHDVQIDSGITLADWLAMPAQKASEPSLEVGAQAVSYVNRYGAFRELLDVCRRASRARRYDGSELSAENAAQYLGEIERARRLLGDWPSLLLTQSRVLATLQDNAGARKALVAWVGVVPSNEPNRPEIVDLLVKSQENLTEVALWNQRWLQRNIEARLKREADLRAEAAARQRLERDRQAVIEEELRKQREMQTACAAAKGGLIQVSSGVLKQCDSGLEWTQSDNGGDISWSGANTHCQSKGASWRLPTVAELQSIYKPELPGKVCWSALFVVHLCNVSERFDLSSSHMWTSELASASEAWGVGLRYGGKHAMSSSRTAMIGALCVRRP
jgi:hypothetical protein